MKLVFKISFCLMALSAPAFGQSANSSSSKEQMMNYVQAGVSGALGGWMIKQGMSQSPTGSMEIAMGGMMVMAGLADLATASNRSGDVAATDAGSGSSGYSPTTTPVPAEVQAAVDSGVAAAKAAGIDPTDPASVASAAQNAGLDDGSGGLAAGMASLSPDTLAGIQKEKDALMSQFHVSAVGTEGGGGGQIAKGNRADDLAGLLAGLGGNKDARNPSSVDGLQKMFNGDAIGVAGDNIFKQVSRRYQTKIQQKTFIIPK